MASSQHAMREPARDWNDYRDAGELLFPGIGAWSYDRFAEYNELHFNNALPAMPITWHAHSPYGGWIGLAAYGNDFAAGRIQVVHKLMRQCDYASHVILHEMIHQSLHLRGENANHNAAPWCREIMRIGREMGLPDFHASPSTVTKQKVLDAAGNPVRDEHGRIVRQSVRAQKPDANGKPSIPLGGGINRFPHSFFEYDEHGNTYSA